MPKKTGRVKGRRVFLSGPMSGIENLNVGAFAEAHAKVKEAGAYEVYNPAIEYLQQPGLEGSHEHSWYMARCINELTALHPYRTHYDVLVLLPGWEGSDGALLEREVAAACGIEVISLDEVV